MNNYIDPISKIPASQCFYERASLLQKAFHKKDAFVMELLNHEQNSCKSRYSTTIQTKNDLQRYWKKINKENETRSMRNQMILSKLGNIEDHMNALSSKSDILRKLRKQYSEALETLSGISHSSSGFKSLDSLQTKSYGNISQTCQYDDSGLNSVSQMLLNPIASETPEFHKKVKSVCLQTDSELNCCALCQKNFSSESSPVYELKDVLSLSLYDVTFGSQPERLTLKALTEEANNLVTLNTSSPTSTVPEIPLKDVYSTVLSKEISPTKNSLLFEQSSSAMSLVQETIEDKETEQERNIVKPEKTEIDIPSRNISEDLAPKESLISLVTKKKTKSDDFPISEVNLFKTQSYEARENTSFRGTEGFLISSPTHASHYVQETPEKLFKTHLIPEKVETAIIPSGTTHDEIPSEIYSPKIIPLTSECVTSFLQQPKGIECEFKDNVDPMKSDISSTKSVNESNGSDICSIPEILSEKPDFDANLSNDEDDSFSKNHVSSLGKGVDGYHALLFGSNPSAGLVNKEDSSSEDDFEVKFACSVLSKNEIGVKSSTENNKEESNHDSSKSSIDKPLSAAERKRIQMKMLNLGQDSDSEVEPLPSVSKSKPQDDDDFDFYG